jgi:hypothetical protein
MTKEFQKLLSRKAVDGPQILSRDLDRLFLAGSWLISAAPEGLGCSCLVLGNLNGGKHRAVHSFEGTRLPAGIDHRFFASATVA